VLILPNWIAASSGTLEAWIQLGMLLSIDATFRRRHTWNLRAMAGGTRVSNNATPRRARADFYSLAGRAGERFARAAARTGGGQGQRASGGRGDGTEGGVRRPGAERLAGAAPERPRAGERARAHLGEQRPMRADEGPDEALRGGFVGLEMVRLANLGEMGIDHCPLTSQHSP